MESPTLFTEAPSVPSSVANDPVAKATAIPATAEPAAIALTFCSSSNISFPTATAFSPFSIIIGMFSFTILAYF